MKSVGEVMAIGRTFQESLQKALCSLETGLTGFDEIEFGAPERPPSSRPDQPQSPDRLRLAALRHARTASPSTRFTRSPASTLVPPPDARVSSSRKRTPPHRPPPSRRPDAPRQAQMGFSDARLGP
jgi:carbamoyl-phosphate synthase large subunit